MLYIVSTPIGNLEDISFRAVRILKEASVIVCEDTRRTSKLLRHYEIPKKKLIVYTDYNKQKVIPKIIEILKTEEVAFVSDNGTPCVSDPGFQLVRECVKQDIQVVPVPGPSAMLAGLVASGLATDKFTFMGFFPKKGNKGIDEIKKSDHTLIFYDSPHRIVKTLKKLSGICPDKQIVIARELTKKFEEFIRGSVLEVYDAIKDRTMKGEIVFLIK